MSFFDWHKHLQRRSAWLTTALLITLLVGLANTSQAPITEAAAANATPSAAGSYEPTERERRVAKLVSSVIERSHYRQSPINDPVSSVTLDRYLETLDSQHSYFLASDIQGFEKIRYQLDDAVLNGSLEPAFAVYNRFQARSRERLNYAMELLKTQPDFTLQETFDYDRTKATWPKTTDEVNELWRKRVKNDALSLMLTGKTWQETHDLLGKRYERALKNMEKITNDDVFEVFVNALVHVFDPHSNYLSPRNSDEFKIQMSLSYEGIGASLQLVDDYVTVQSTIPGGSAAASGMLNASDRILAVGEGKDGKLVDVVGWRLDDVVQLIRGKEGSTVRLQLMPAGAAPGSPEKTIALVRSKITLEAQAAKKDIRTMKRDGKDIKVGVITVPSFYQDYDAHAKGDQNYRSTTRDVRNLINELKTAGVEAVVIDLRANGGGNLQEAVGMVGLFIPAGPAVQVRQTGGDIEVLNDDDTGVAWDGPLTVLTDRYSASASEIFSGAIQDYGRGLILGQQTYGKGTVQNLYPLDRYAVGKDPGFGELTITIGKFYRVTGESTQLRGVMPDVTLPSAISTDDAGESTQESALPWDRIRSAGFARVGNLKGAIDSLVLAHNQRVGGNADYQYLLKNIAAYEQLRKEKTISLNLKERQQEREQLDKARLDRENARRVVDGQKPVDSLEALEKQKEEVPDGLLNEAAEITADLDTWLTRNRQASINVATPARK
jgi:carboxyl-terminal processing protease